MKKQDRKLSVVCGSEGLLDRFLSLLDERFPNDKPAPWALAYAQSVIKLEPMCSYRDAYGKPFESEEDIRDYAHRLSRKYGYDESAKTRMEEHTDDLEVIIIKIIHYGKPAS